MAHQFPDPSSTSLPLPSNEISPCVERLLATVRNAQPSDIINQVHQTALVKYHKTKKEKQEELASRVSVALHTGDRSAFKNAKKKVDNHASSVASRCRRTFLISRFETLLREKSDQNRELCDIILRMNIDAIKKDSEMRRAIMRKNGEIHLLQWKISTLNTKLDSLIAHVAKTENQLGMKPATVSVRESEWEAGETRTETLGPDSTTISDSAESATEIGEFQRVNRANITLEALHGENEEGVGFYSCMEGIGMTSQKTLHNTDWEERNLKMDGSQWGSTPFVDLRDAQVQMKADAPSDVLYPAV